MVPLLTGCGLSRHARDIIRQDVPREPARSSPSTHVRTVETIVLRD